MSNTWAEEMVYKYHKEIQKLTKERNQLKQQLAEKDEEIEILDKNNAFLRGVWEANEQDKISFAVAELKKVRKYVDGRTYLAQYLDERVKQLKEGK